MTRRRSIRLAVSVVIAAVGLLGLPAPAAHAQLFGMSEQQEIQIGRSIEQQLAKNPGFVDDPEQTQYVTDLGLQLAKVSERPNLPWTYHIIKDDVPDAVAAPGGFIFVTSGLLQFVQSKDELAFVLGHETTHVAHRHAVQLAETDMMMQVGALLVAQFVFPGNYGAYEASQLTRQLVDARYSRAKEAEADHWGVIYAQRAGYDPTASLMFFERLETTEKTESNVITHAFEDHPNTPARVAALEIELRQMGYDVPAPTTAPATMGAGAAPAMPPGSSAGSGPQNR
ncbi:MAG TPA: M48 family metalloprotease [bacterium]|nr:M48 family metalloprotease [bacterium]